MWQAQYTEPSAVRVASAVHRAFWRSCCARGRRAAAGFRVAGAVHRIFWRSCCARGRRWAAAGFCVANGLSWERRVHRVSWRSCCARGRRWAAAGFCVANGLSWERCSTQRLLEELLRAWAPLGRGLTCGVIRSFYFIFVQYSKYCASFLEGLGSVKMNPWIQIRIFSDPLVN